MRCSSRCTTVPTWRAVSVAQSNSHGRLSPALPARRSTRCAARGGGRPLPVRRQAAQRRFTRRFGRLLASDAPVTASRAVEFVPTAGHSSPSAGRRRVDVASAAGLPVGLHLRATEQVQPALPHAWPRRTAAAASPAAASRAPAPRASDRGGLVPRRCGDRRHDQCVCALPAELAASCSRRLGVGRRPPLEPGTITVSYCRPLALCTVNNSTRMACPGARAHRASRAPRPRLSRSTGPLGALRAPPAFEIGRGLVELTFRRARRRSAECVPGALDRVAQTETPQLAERLASTCHALEPGARAARGVPDVLGRAGARDRRVALVAEQLVQLRERQPAPRRAQHGEPGRAVGRDARGRASARAGRARRAARRADRCRWPGTHAASRKLGDDADEVAATLHEDRDTCAIVRPRALARRWPRRFGLVQTAAPQQRVHLHAALPPAVGPVLGV